MPITSPGNDDDTGENHQPTLRKNTAEPVEQTLKQNSLELATKPHYRKDTEERGLFSEDRAALLPLPGKRFDVVTWRHMKADRYGVAAPGDGIAVPRTGRTRAEG